MTAGTLVLAGARPDRVGWQHVRQLTAIEARKYALRASVWIGWAATVLMRPSPQPSPRKRGEGDEDAASVELPLPACGERVGVRGVAL